MRTVPDYRDKENRMNGVAINSEDGAKSDIVEEKAHDEVLSLTGSFGCMQWLAVLLLMPTTFAGDLIVNVLAFHTKLP